MEAKDIKSDLVAAALMRLKEFADCITEKIGWRAKKNVYALVNRELEAKTGNPEYLHLVVLEILRKIKQPEYLTQKLIAFGDYGTIFNILFVSLYNETEGAKSFWKFWRPLIFRGEDKEKLINFLLAGENKLQVFYDIRVLLTMAKVISYDCQQKLYLEYIVLQGQFTTPADLLDAYESWTGLSPDLRERLRQIIKSALMHFRFRVWREKKAGTIEVVENKTHTPDSDSGSN